MRAIALLKLGDSCADAAERVRKALARHEIEAVQPRSRGAREWPVLIALFDATHPDDALRFLLDHAADAWHIVLATTDAATLDDSAVCRLLVAGAADLVDVGAEHIDHELARLSERVRRWDRVDEIATSSLVRESLVGFTPVWRRAVLHIVEASTGSTMPVLLTGETGTGKEEAARLIHDLDATRGGPFVVVDCAAIVESLSGSELFGHRRGAFTGADRDREGAIARADRGTLFLDEVGELRPLLQAELLRVLQQGTYKPVGDDSVRQSRFRLVSATNRDLEQMVRAGQFRSDLYYRISSRAIHLPPLRERIDDVPSLLRHFLGQCFAPRRAPELDPRLERVLRSLPYDGNVRELRNIAHALAASHEEISLLTLADLPSNVLARLVTEAPVAEDCTPEPWIEKAIESGGTLAQILNTTRDAVIRVALAKTQGRAGDAATRLGVSGRLVQLRRAAWRKHSPRE